MTETGWVACDCTQGDRLADVRHAPVRDTSAEAMADSRAYEGVRYAAEDGYLYVEEPTE